MTDGLMKSHLRKALQVGLSEVGLPDIYRNVRLGYISNLSYYDEVPNMSNGI